MEHIKKDQEYDQYLKMWIKHIAQGKENEFKESDGEILRFKDILYVFNILKIRKMIFKDSHIVVKVLILDPPRCI